MTQAGVQPHPPVPNQDRPNWVLNLIAFQAGWWALVLTAAQGRPELGLGVVALVLAWHLGRVRPLGFPAAWLKTSAKASGEDQAELGAKACRPSG